MPKDVLPEKLQEARHWDWPWPLSLIPRAWTSFDWGPPKQIAGDQMLRAEGGYPKPIGEPRSWQLSVYPGAPWWAKPFAWYVAYSGKAGKDGNYRHFRLGTRWDDVDNYCTILSIASRKFPVDGERDTST